MAEIDGTEVARKLGLSVDELNSLYSRLPVGGWVGATVAADLCNRFGLDELEPPGAQLAARGVLTEAEGIWLDDAD